jgi:DNA polymerase-3 subunit alpha
MHVLVFDTETTGLPKSKIINKDSLHLWPHVVQFSYIIYDMEKNTIVKIKDSIIKIPNTIVITEDIAKIHGITNEISAAKGINIVDVFEEFFVDFNNVDNVVGHNVSFDINMIKAELNRIILDDSLLDKHPKFQNYLQKVDITKNIYCTMKESISLCAIETKDKFGRIYNKFPKLVELYQKLFNVKPNNLHNSLNDVIVCLRCFAKLKYNIDIVDYNNEVKKLIHDYL